MPIGKLNYQSRHKIRRAEKISSCTKNGIFSQLPAIKRYNFWCSQKIFRPFLFRDGFKMFFTLILTQLGEVISKVESLFSCTFSLQYYSISISKISKFKSKDIGRIKNFQRIYVLNTTMCTYSFSVHFFLLNVTKLLFQQ